MERISMKKIITIGSLLGILVFLLGFLTGCDDIPLRLTIDEISTRDPVWNEMAVLKPSTPAGGELFGFSVDISDTFAVVGAYGYNSLQGRVYIFKRNKNNWEQMDPPLTAPDGEAGDLFGYSVAVSGNYIVVGAPGWDNGGDLDAGAAYLFQYENESWETPDSLSGSDGCLDCPVAAGDATGFSVDINGDYIAVGAPYDQSNVGIVYIFYRNEGGVNNWDRYGGSINSGEILTNEFGTSVALSDLYLVVGAPKDSETAAQSGAFYFFRRTGISSWSSETKVKPETPGIDYNFGQAVDIYNNTVIVGEHPNDTSYLYRLDGGAWEKLETIQSSLTAANDNFGSAVAVTDNYVLVGAPSRSVDNKSQAGAAYLFENIDEIVELNYITNDVPAVDDKMGSSAAISRNFAIISTPYDDETEIDSGKVTIYLKEE